MGYVNGIANPPLGWGDISRITGVAGPPYDLGNMIVKGTRINKNSLYKPIRHSSIKPLTDTQWKAANYGWEISTKSTPELAVTDWQNKAGWVYQKPRGAAYNEWFRASDFYGYDSNAEAFFQVEALGANHYIGQTVSFNFSVPDGVLSWGYFNGTPWYLGVVALHGNELYYYPLTSSTTGLTTQEMLDNGRFTIPLDSSIFVSNNDYKFIPVITTYDADALSQGWSVGTPDAARYVCWPVTKMTEFVVYAQTAAVTIEKTSAVAYFAGNAVNIDSIDFDINLQSQFNVTNLHIYVYALDYSNGPTPTEKLIGDKLLSSVGIGITQTTVGCDGSICIETAGTEAVQCTLRATYTMSGTTYTMDDYNFTISNKEL